MRMRLRFILASGCSLLFAACQHAPSANADTTLAQARQAIGAGEVRSLSFTASGTGGTVGQAWQAGQTWPKLNYSKLARQMDYERGAIGEEFARSRAEVNGGGGIPPLGQGEARGIGWAMGDHAWNVAASNATAAPVALESRLMDLWTSPHGALHAAQRFGARAEYASEGGQRYTQLRYTVPGTGEATAWVDANGLVTRVDARLPHPVLGEIDMTTRYSDWRSVGTGGVKFPYRITQAQGGEPAYELTVQSVDVNPALNVSVPDNVRAFTERATAEAVAPGVWFLAGGSHNSVLIEMADHAVIVEAPLYDGRTSAVFAQARQLLPGKPVRYVINSHHHFDHAGGLRTAAAEGATIVASAQAKPYLERVLNAPRRIKPDRLAQSGQTARVNGVNGKLVLSDGQRTVEIHEIADSIHAVGFLAVYLPAEKLLIEADAYTPGPPNAPRPANLNPATVNLAHNLDRLGLKPERILPLHGRVVPVAELMTAAGR